MFVQRWAKCSFFNTFRKLVCEYYIMSERKCPKCGITAPPVPKFLFAYTKPVDETKNHGGNLRVPYETHMEYECMTCGHDWEEVHRNGTDPSEETSELTVALSKFTKSLKNGTGFI